MALTFYYKPNSHANRGKGSQREHSYLDGDFSVETNMRKSTGVTDCQPQPLSQCKSIAHDCQSF